MFEDTKDIRKLDLFWSEEEKKEHQVWESNLSHVMQFLSDHKYEIQQHFSSLDWLRLYADSILDMDVDMNLVLRLETEDR